MQLALPLLLLPSLWPSVACANSTALLKGTKRRGAVHQSPMKSVSAAAAAAAGDASGNSETSSLAGLEFNTPYSHQIAALSAVLLIVASVALVLAIKFTQRAAAANEFKSAATEDSAVDIDEADDEELETVEPGDEAGEEAAGRRESVPIMQRFIFSKPSSNYSYESLLQTKRRTSDEASGDSGLEIAVCRFSARLDEANGLLCLHDFQLSLRALEDSERSNLDSWTLAIDIVAQTDLECRQMRLETRLRRASGDEEEAGQGGGGDGWLSEPIDDVLAVRIKQNAATRTPPKGRLLIRALALQGSIAPTASGEPRQKKAESAVSSMLKLGGATFALNRIRRPSMQNLEVTLREKS